MFMSTSHKNIQNILFCVVASINLVQWETEYNQWDT
jgi:hypothetical protein